ncbi:MAG: type IV toxin-antitoxin system AbiEi family antitoxin domain-containing protein [Propionibacteriaceae bacterium]|jgi:predicted transcriptional regulator of viral defense system|nr:type IV toxin-antitoxin system AbiEi family antitoxin domain-containing protein [Propionibacteriaceae bacterium]
MAEVWNQLWDIAVDQYGYVTSDDADKLGLAHTVLGKMASRGRLERISFGLYRFPQWPVSANDSLMEAVLWTRDPAAVLSHDTALDVLDLCDVNPAKIHVTIPRQRPLRRAETPGLYVIHRETLADDQRGWWEQIPTVTPDTAILQGIGEGLRPTLVEQAIDTALRRSLIDTETAARRRRDLEERFR